MTSRKGIKRVLFVGMSDSVHTARWIDQLDRQEWEVHLFPSLDVGRVHPKMRGISVYHSVYARSLNGRGQGNSYSGLDVISSGVAHVARLTLKELWPDYRKRQLKRLIRKLQPDLVHSLEIQAAGYLVEEIKTSWTGAFPRWMVTNWGSDISLFGVLPEHQQRIRRVLESCDYYSCECRRDVALGVSHGFKGKVMPVVPNTGGFELEQLEKVRNSVPASSRKVIMLKGYQHWAGRALVGLRALERCADLLPGYTLAIYSANADVLFAARLFSERNGIPLHIIEPGTSHDDLLQWHARARISIGLSIGDAISTSLLEAMVMGSFPIQSCTACVDEWLESGANGLVVPPEDPDLIEFALRQALTDDALVDAASSKNWQIAKERLQATAIREQVRSMYRGIADEVPDTTGRV